MPPARLAGVADPDSETVLNTLTIPVTVPRNPIRVLIWAKNLIAGILLVRQSSVLEKHISSESSMLSSANPFLFLAISSALPDHLGAPEHEKSFENIDQTESQKIFRRPVVRIIIAIIVRRYITGPPVSRI